MTKYRRYRIYQDKDDPVVRRQRGAWFTIIFAVILDIFMGISYSFVEHISVPLGLYWAEAEATTVGSEIVPHTIAGHWIKAIVGISVVPLFAATFSIFTTALTATHVHSVGQEIKTHVTRKIDSRKQVKPDVRRQAGDDT